MRKKYEPFLSKFRITQQILLVFFVCTVIPMLLLEFWGTRRAAFRIQQLLSGKLFTQKMGQNFNSYLDQVRLSEAEKLLNTTSMKVYEIAEKVGYKNGLLPPEIPAAIRKKPGRVLEEAKIKIRRLFYMTRDVPTPLPQQHMIFWMFCFMMFMLSYSIWND